MVTDAEMRKFLTRSRFLVLLLSATESWALPSCAGSKPYKILGTIAGDDLRDEIAETFIASELEEVQEFSAACLKRKT